MKKTKITVKRDGQVVNVTKEKRAEFETIYRVKTQVSSHVFITYEGFPTQPKIRGREIKTGDIVKCGQEIMG